MHRAVADFYRRTFGLRCLIPEEFVYRGQTCRAFCDDGFEAPDEIFAGSTSDVSGAVVVVVGEEAANFAVLLNAPGPVVLMVFLHAVLIDAGKRSYLALQVEGFFDVVRIGLMPAVLLLI